MPYEVLAVTGYKPHEMGIYKNNAEEIRYIKKTIEKRLRNFLEDGLKWVVISGQPGVEMWTGEVVQQLRKQGEDVKLAVLIPFLQQEQIWNETLQHQYQQLLSVADYVDEISKRPYQSPAQLRVKNDFIVAKTDAMLILYNEEQVGTPKYYLQAAERRAQSDVYPIVFITPDELQDTVQEEMESIENEDW